MGSEHFTVECLQFFAELDKDGNGSLDAQELFPMILALSNAHQLALDDDQCKKFTAIFDDSKTGVISKSEFVNFSRFLIIMGYLESQDGQQIMEIVKQEEKRQAAAQRSPNGAARSPPKHNAANLNSSSASMGATSLAGGPASPAHLALDVDFFQKKSDKLTEENDILREKVQSLERMMRKMEAKMEEQFMKLRHQEVDLKAAYS